MATIYLYVWIYVIIILWNDMFLYPILVSPYLIYLVIVWTDLSIRKYIENMKNVK